jgi:ferrous-iron efflux pump FieF
VGSALFVLIGAIERLISPQLIEPGAFPLVVLTGAIAATFALIALQRWVINRTGSTAITADRLHYAADFATNLVALATLLATIWLGIHWLDPLAATLVALYLAWQGVKIGKDAIDTLMDRELGPEERQRITDLVQAHPDVADCHDLRTRRAGNTVFIELHVELDPVMTVRRAHSVADALEATLTGAFGAAEVILHQEPAGLDDDRLDHRIAETDGKGVVR